jgi:hypothetical protein
VPQKFKPHELVNQRAQRHRSVLERNESTVLRFTMESVVHEALNNLRKSITCCICLGYYVRPVTLSCNHSYCEECIEPVLSGRKICPICSLVIRRRNIEDECHLQDTVDKISKFVADMDTTSNSRTGAPTSSVLRQQSKKSCGDRSVESIAGYQPQARTVTPAVMDSPRGVPVSMPLPAFVLGELVCVAMRTSAGNSLRYSVR